MKKSVYLIILLSLTLFGCTTKNILKNINEDPKWVKTLIDEIEGKALWESPGIIKRCNYQEKIAYYISSPCCDFLNYLYDENKQVICAPDGGMTGRGDGKCSDFSSIEESCEVIWEYTRSE